MYTQKRLEKREALQILIYLCIYLLIFRILIN